MWVMGTGVEVVLAVTAGAQFLSSHPDSTSFLPLKGRGGQSTLAQRNSLKINAWTCPRAEHRGAFTFAPNFASTGNPKWR